MSVYLTEDEINQRVLNDINDVYNTVKKSILPVFGIHHKTLDNEMISFRSQ